MKLLGQNSLKEEIASIRGKGKKIVFTNGCFDLFHAGHLKTFEEAKKFGDVLIVAVNSDASIRRLKGEKRPIISEYDRMQLIAALSCVDYVTLFQEDSPRNLIREIAPDIVIKGADWKEKALPEQDVIDEVGAQVKYIELQEGISSSIIIQKIKEAY